MAVRQYIGARYVPKFFEGANYSAEWMANTQYEALTIVTRNGNSYTSRKPVPASVGAPEDNPEYWVSTGIYNQQVEQYRQEVQEAIDTIDEINDDVKNFNNNCGYNVAEIGVYDTNINDGLQGAFTDGNMWYQYIDENGSGRILSFNLGTGRYVETINKNLYHGNDFVKCGNYIYCAPYSNLGGGVNKLLRFTLDGSVDELNVFDGTIYNCLYAVDKIDDTTLICALRPFGNNAVTSSAFYLYHIDTQNIENIIVNWNNIPTQQNGFPHSMVYNNGKLYLSAGTENGFYIFEYKNKVLTALSYNSIPKKNGFGLAITEVEGMGFIDYYGDKFIVFTTPTDVVPLSIMFCAINLTGSSPVSMLPVSNITNKQFTIEVSNNDPSLIYETGSAQYPVKSVGRACIIASYNYGGGLSGNVQLPVIVNEPNKSKIVLRGENIALVAHSNTTTFSQPVETSRASIFFAGVFVFNNSFSAYSNSNINFGAQGNTFNAMTIQNSKVFESAPNSHLGHVEATFAEYCMSILATQTPDIKANYNNLIQVNKTVSTGIDPSGGTTVLLSGVK